jgi:hypothetical protein
VRKKSSKKNSVVRPRKILQTQVRLLIALGLNDAEITEVLNLTTAYAIAHIQGIGANYGRKSATAKR